MVGNQTAPTQRLRKVNDLLRTTNDDPDQAEGLRTFKAEAWPLLPSLLRVAVILTHDPDRAEDLVQETMMRGFRHIATYRPGTNMKAWLMTILRRTHIDLYRRDKRRVPTVSYEPRALAAIAPADDAPSPADWSEPDELLDRFDDASIEAALRRLPDPMRWVLLLVDIEQMTVAEAAVSLDVPVGTVKSRASRARTRLRVLLDPVARERGWLHEPQGG